MNAKKYKTALLALILLAGSFFIASAENNSIQYIVKTQYFDIIYKAPSRETAKLISENVEFVDEEEPATEAAATEETTEDDEEEYFCPECGAKITLEMTHCPNCGVEFEFTEDEE